MLWPILHEGVNDTVSNYSTMNKSVSMNTLPLRKTHQSKLSIPSQGVNIQLTPDRPVREELERRP